MSLTVLKKIIVFLFELTMKKHFLESQTCSDLYERESIQSESHYYISVCMKWAFVMLFIKMIWEYAYTWILLINGLWWYPQMKVWIKQLMTISCTTVWVWLNDLLHILLLRLIVFFSMFFFGCWMSIIVFDFEIVVLQI